MSSNLIYGLVDPNTSQVRYIGLSSTGFKRPLSHCRPSSVDDTRRGRWLRTLFRQGVKPIIQVLHVAPNKGDLPVLERHWIALGRSLGWQLTNHTGGGEGIPDA